MSDRFDATQKRPGTRIMEALVGSTVIGAILTALFGAWSYKRQYDDRLNYELIAPIVIAMRRSEAIAHDYRRGEMTFARARYLFMLNGQIVKLMEDKAGLLPPHLTRPVTCLMIHYDAWSMRYETMLDAEAAANANGKPLRNGDVFDIGFENKETECSKSGGFPTAEAEKIFAFHKELQDRSSIFYWFF